MQLTCYHVAHEWSRYADKRHFLRVSYPEGMQRSRYFISLPFKYSVPMMVAFTTMCVLVSQSVFLVNCKIYSLGDDEFATPYSDGNSFVTTGFSCKGILMSTCVSTAIIALMVTLSFLKRIHSSMPTVATCSAASSAGCHRPSEDQKAHLFLVQWGIIRKHAQSDASASVSIGGERLATG
jgi:hypothetical protein